MTLTVDHEKSRLGALGKWCTLVALAVAVIAAAMLGAAAARAEEPPAEPEQRLVARKPTLALLPMVVHSNEDPEYLRQGLSDMLTARFTKDAMVDVIVIEDSARATTDLDSAIDTARDAGAEYVLFGSFTRFGQGASLDVQTAATAAGPDGDTLREIFVHSGSIGAVIPDLDDLVGKVTRFTVGEDAPSAADDEGGGAVAAGRGAASADLLRRIEALEAQVRAMQGPTAGP